MNQLLDHRELETLNIDELEKFFSTSIIGHSRPQIYSKPEGLFRIRKINNEDYQHCSEKLNTIELIWYRDWSKVAIDQYTFNRCSTKGQNFFYASNNLETAVKEVNAKHGEKLLIGIFKLFPENSFLCQFAGIESLKNNPDFIEKLNSYPYVSDRDKRIEGFIASKFEQKVLSGQESEYRYSIAFSNILLNNPEIEGIIYPSVANDLESSNYGIKPESVDTKLYCENAFIYQLNLDELIPLKVGMPIEKSHSSPKYYELNWEEYSEEEKKKFKRKYCL